MACRAPSPALGRSETIIASAASTAQQRLQTRKRRSAMRAIWFKQLYVQVIIGIIAGGLLGVFSPDFAVLLQPFADGFIKLIKMLLAPIIFATVVLGLAKMGNVKEVGRIGVRAILFFEVVATLALVIGLVVVNLVRPGEGMNIDANHIDAGAITGYTRAAASHGGTVAFLLDIIPGTMIGAFANGAMLQVILGPSAPGDRTSAGAPAADRAS